MLNWHSDALADVMGGGRSATCGVVVFKGSMANWRGGVDLPVHINLFGVVVFKGSMLDGG